MKPFNELRGIDKSRCIDAFAHLIFKATHNLNFYIGNCF